MELFIKALPFLVGGTGAIFFLWGAYRLSVLTTLQKAVEAQKGLIDTLTSKVDTLEAQRTEDSKLISELKGALAGKRESMEDLIAAIARTSLCANAPGCPNRVMPKGGE